MPLVAAAAITAGGALLASNSASKAASKSAAASQAATDQAVAEQRRQYDQSRADYAPYLATGTNALNTLGRLYGISGSQQTANSPSVAYPTGQSGAYASYGDLSRPDTAMDQAQMYGQDPFSMVANAPVSGYGQTQVGTGQQGAAVPVPQVGQGQGGNFDTFWQSPDYQFRMNESMRALTARNAALGIQDSGAAQRSALTLAGNQASGEFNNYANRLAALAGVGQTTAQNNAALGQNYAGAVGQLGMNNAQNLSSSYAAQSQAQQGLYSGLAGLGSGLIAQRWPVK